MVVMITHSLTPVKCRPFPSGAYALKYNQRLRPPLHLDLLHNSRVVFEGLGKAGQQILNSSMKVGLR
ncbi:hypothetical protein LguiB_020280 [Lonicera macranthoides]